MARALVVKIVGDASSLERTFKRTSVAANQFDRNVTHAFRGVVSGSGIMRSFGRSLAFASGGFLAFEGVTHFLEESIRVAREAAVTQRSLAAQMKTSGESFKSNSRVIEDATTNLGKFGFTSEEAEKALVVLDRGTGRVDQAISLLGLSADLARAKQIDLSAAGNVVAKVFGGQETALRRAVPGLESNAHGWDLIRLAQQRLAGQAAAGTTPLERFNAEIFNTQKIIGTTLLPTLNKYLTSLSEWLDKMNRSGRLQKDVAGTARGLATAFDVVTTAIGKAAQAYEGYQKIVSHAPGGGGGGGGFLQHLLGGTVFAQIKDFEGRVKHLGELFGLVRRQAREAERNPLGRGAFGASLFGGAIPPGAVGGAAGAFAGGANLPRPATVEQRNAAFDATIGRQLGRVQDISTVRGQIARLQQLAGLITRRIAVTKDITRRLMLEDEVLGIFRTIKADRQQLAQDAIDALSLNVARAGLTATMSDDVAALEAVNAKLAEQQKQLGFTTDREQQIIANLQQIQADRQQAAQAAHDALVARQFAALGLGPTGEDLPPTIKALQKQAAAVQEALGGIADSKTRQQLARIKRVLGGGFGAVTAEVKQRIKELLDTLQPKGGLAPEFRHLGTRAILKAAGLDLTPDATRRLRSVLAGLNPAGNVIGGRTRAFAADVTGGGITIHGGVHLHGVQDVRAFEDQLTRREAARSHRRRGAH